MKAQLSIEPGGPDSLHLTSMDDPQPKPGEVVVKIKAAGVNYPDALIIRDMYQVKPPRPFAPGSEMAGDILAVGDKVSGFAVGDRVIGMSTHGGFASHATLASEQLIKFPDVMPYDEAACFILTYGTSYHALKNRAQLKAGETILILGAAGGVGVAAIELAKAMGARVIAAVSSEEKAQFCKGLGADETLIYKRDLDRDDQKEFSQQIKAAAGASGVDVVYDAVGGAYSEPAFRSLSWEGRFLVVGFPSGIPKIPLNLPLLKGAQILGVFWGAWTRQDPAGHQENTRELFDLYTAGKLKPRIMASFPLEQAPQALDLLETRKARGKIVVTMTSDG